MSKSEAIRQNPDFPWLSLDDVEGLARFMCARGWLEPGETIAACEKAGEGNMNLTLRVRTATRSVILKQSRPWVEKYEHIEAPPNRSQYEQAFYRRASEIEGAAERMPRLLGADSESCTLLLEDLSEAQDFTTIYARESISSADLVELAEFAAALHEATAGDADAAFANREMRALNHQHIFEIPLQEDNGLVLDGHEPGLDAAAARIKQDTAFVERTHETGKRYLADGRHLVHGDYFPGSWLRTEGGVRVIDPEFCFYGDAEFDLGFAIAHFALCDQPRSTSAAFLEHYRQARAAELLDRWIARYAAAEIMRRLIGVAQLPIPPSDGFRADLLERSRQVMLKEELEPLWQ